MSICAAAAFVTLGWQWPTTKERNRTKTWHPHVHKFKRVVSGTVQCSSTKFYCNTFSCNKVRPLEVEGRMAQSWHLTSPPSSSLYCTCQYKVKNMAVTKAWPPLVYLVTKQISSQSDQQKYTILFTSLLYTPVKSYNRLRRNNCVPCWTLLMQSRYRSPFSSNRYCPLARTIFTGLSE